MNSRIAIATRLFAFGVLLFASWSGPAQAETPREVVARYQDEFSYSFDLPDKWEMIPVTKYQVRLEPVNDRTRVGIAFNADILHAVFGTEGYDLDQYRKSFFSRIAQSGYRIESAKPFTGLNIGRQWSSWVVDRPDGKGKELLVMTRDKEFVFYFAVVFIDEFERYLERYKGDLEHIVTQVQIDVE